MLVHRVEGMLKPKCGTEKHTEKRRGYAARNQGPAKRHFKFAVQKVTYERDAEPLAEVCEHYAEKQEICYSNHPCRVHLVVGRQAVYAYKVLKRAEKLLVF